MNTTWVRLVALVLVVALVGLSLASLL